MQICLKQQQKRKMLENSHFPALFPDNLNFMHNRIDNGLFPDGQNYDEESNAHSTHQSYTNVPVSSKNLADGTLYKFGLIHLYLLIDKVLDTCELFMSLLIPCIIIKDGTTFCGSIVVAKMAERVCW